MSRRSRILIGAVLRCYPALPVKARFVPIGAALVLLSAGCHVGSPRRVISAIPRNTADAVFVSEHAGLAHEAMRNQLSIYWNGPNRGPGISRQIELVERAIEENDFGIVLSPASPFALDTVVERALSRSIPVVVLGPPLPLAANANLSFVSNDTDRSAQLAAERIHADVGEQGEVALVGIDPMETGSTECARAFEVALAAKAPHVRIVSRLVRTFSWGQSEVAVRQVLEEHPGITAVYALTLNDVRATVGAISALGREGQIKVVGNDQALDVLYHLRHGLVDSLVVPDMHGMGEQALRNIVALREHRKIAVKIVFEPVLVTRDNLDTERIQQRIKLDWRPPS